MKRRKFIRKIGLGTPAVLAAGPDIPKMINPISETYVYPRPRNLQDALSKEGEHIVRLEFRSDQEGYLTRNQGKLDVSGAEIVRMKTYFFESGEDVFIPDEGSYQIQAGAKQVDVMVIWLKNAGQDTEITVSEKEETFPFNLTDLIEQPEFSGTINQLRITANLLLDKEIGYIEPLDFNASDPGDVFRVAIMADPQGGDPQVEGNHPTRMKIHNAWIEECIRQVNQLDPAPVCTLMLGDIVDGQGQPGNFRHMHRFFEALQPPILYAIGNHETRYRSVFTPGYNMDAFNNYFAAQKQINDLELMLYAFDLGRWHLIIWPDPLRANFWETHPHYFDWLERDLEINKDRPTIFFQHVPSHPIGINPLINYAESVAVKRTLLDILARHGNVRYIFSGHVHIPVKASFKTAVTYKGMNMINLPPAGYRPRAFGEEDFAGGPCQGILILEFNGDQVKPVFRTVTEEEFFYPEKLPEFDEEKYALWLKYKWELPMGESLVNGSFEAGLQGWTPRFVYMEDDHPSNRCEIRRMPRADSFNALYLYSRKRGYDIPGQDRLPQDINRISQAVAISGLKDPYLKLSYRIDGKQSDLEGWCGAYVWVEGFRGSSKYLSLIYSSGVIYAGVGGKFNNSEFSENIHLALNEEPDKWQDTQLYIVRDFETHSDKRFNDLELDRLVLTLGVWTINDGGDFPYGIYFDELEIGEGKGTALSTVGDLPVKTKAEEKIWWLNKYFPFSHVAGEHRYILATKPMKTQ